MQNNPITFSKDPTKISAFYTYMGGNINLPKWDLGEGKYKYWGLQEQILNDNVESIHIKELSFSIV